MTMPDLKPCRRGASMKIWTDDECEQEVEC